MDSSTDRTADICDLCGLPLRHGLVELPTQDPTCSELKRFCCMGCRQVYSMLMAAHADSEISDFKQTPLYRQCLEMGLIPRSEGELAQRLADDPVAGNITPEPRRDSAPAIDTLPLRLKIDGMWCPSCAWIVEEALKKLPGVQTATCAFSNDTARCDYDPVRTGPDRIVARIKSLGYRPRLPGEDKGQLERRRAFIRLSACAFLTMNVMMLSFALYSGFFARLGPGAVHKLAWPMLLMTLVVMGYGGRPIFTRAKAGLTSAAFGMDTLIAIGSLSAFGFSLYNMWQASLHLYFDTASMLITLVLLGKSLEARAKDRAHRELDSFFNLRPTKVNICTEAFPAGRYVRVENLGVGDVFAVGEEEIAAADGTVLSGTATMDESSLTGEAKPRFKTHGDRIVSGTVVSQGRITVRVERVGNDATLGRMIRAMEQTLSRKTPLEDRTDKILRGFVPAVIVLAGLTIAAGLLWELSAAQAVMRGITVLVIACPCALGIAIPLARVAGMTLAGRHGVLVRDFEAFSQATRIDTLVLDKTGTVTTGRWRLEEIRLEKTLGNEAINENCVLAWAAGLEWRSEHPVALEIKRRATERKLELPRIEDRQAFSDGISGRVGSEDLRIGSRRFMARELSADAQICGGVTDTPVDTNTDPLRSMVFLSRGDCVVARFYFGDRLKPEARATIRHLQSAGIDLSLVSGDGEAITRRVARQLGILNVAGGCSPLEKAAYIKQCQQKGRHVAMVGDGINDAAAMVQADLGMAVYAGSHLGKEAAAVTLMRGDLVQLQEFFNLARKTNRKINQNFACSLIYNLLSIPIAMAGLLNPIVAVCAMLLSSLSVIGNTLLLLRKNGS